MWLDDPTEPEGFDINNWDAIDNWDESDALQLEHLVSSYRDAKDEEAAKEIVRLVVSNQPVFVAIVNKQKGVRE